MYVHAILSKGQHLQDFKVPIMLATNLLDQSQTFICVYKYETVETLIATYQHLEDL